MVARIYYTLQDIVDQICRVCTENFSKYFNPITSNYVDLELQVNNVKDAFNVNNLLSRNKDDYNYSRIFKALYYMPIQAYNPTEPKDYLWYQIMTTTGNPDEVRGSEFSIVSILDKPEIDEFWKRLLIKYEKGYVISASEDATDDNLKTPFRRVLARIFEKIVETQDSYIPLIRFQEANIDKLTEDLKIINSITSKFNDTPQSEGDYSTSDYTSTITKTINETSSPIGNIADKLDVARKALTDIYDKWIYEFRTYFDIF